MFTMKTERPNPSEITATRPSATMIERIAISTGTSRQPEGELAVLEVALRLLAEVVVGRAIAGDAHRERAAVRLLHDLLDGAGVRVAADDEREEDGVPVLRHARELGGEDLARRAKLGAEAGGE